MSPERRPERSFCFVTNLNERLEAALDERFTLERELGRCGMATEYRGRDVRFDECTGGDTMTDALLAAPPKDGAS